jgi:hypothetical protein
VIPAARPGALPRDIILIPCRDNRDYLLPLFDLYKGVPVRIVY